MTRRWPSEPLGSLLVPVARPEPVDASREYCLLGARWYAQGLFVKERKPGHQIRASRLYRVVRGDFVYNRLFAWKGSFAVAGDEADGCHVSNEFPCFRTRDDRLDPGFLRWYFHQERAWNEALGLSEGATPTSRNRLKEDRFLAMEIPLPDPPEQRRLVALIEAVMRQANDAARLRGEAAQASRTLLARLRAGQFPPPTARRVGDFVRFQTGYAFRSEWFTEDGIRLARNVNVGHGTLDWTETARIPLERRGEFQRFELAAGDVLVSLDRPLISTGAKVARVRPEDLPCLLLQRVARAQIRTPDLDPEYLLHWLRSTHFADAIDPGRSNGVPHISHREIERIRFEAPSQAQQARAVAACRILDDAADRLDRLRAESVTLSEALQPAILDRAFRGGL